jgi:hypothetical protein
MRPKLSPPAGARVTGPRIFRAVPGERRGDPRALDLARFRPIAAGGRPARASSCLPAWPATPGRTARQRPAGGHAGPLHRAAGGTVRTCLDRLEAEGIISPCDPGIVAARIRRAGRRPQGWDLNLGMVRDDLAEAGIVKLECQFPGLAARLAIMARPGPDDQTDLGTHRTSRSEPASLWITPPARCRCAPRGERGATSTPTGCNRLSHGGAAMAP